MRILFLTDNFPPEVNAPATRTYEHCKRWVAAGADVVVITCAPNFPQGRVYQGYRNRCRSLERVDGIRVVRVWSYIAANENFLRRTIDFASFAASAFIIGLLERADVIVATSPQFFTAFAGYGLSLVKRRPWIFELRDIWPDSIATVGQLSRRSWLFRLLESIELFLYRQATRVVAVAPGFVDNLAGRGIDPAKIDVITNGVDLTQFQPRPSNDALRKELGISDRFVIGYVGTHGLAHGLSFIVDSMKELQDEKLHMIFLGDGAKKHDLRERARSLELKNVSFHDPVSKADVPLWLAACDAVVVPLIKSDTFKTVIPSKIFEAAAMGLPILLGVDGQAREIVERFNAGLFYEPENAVAFQSAVRRLSNDPELRRALSKGGRHLAAAYDRDVLAARMHDLLRRVVAGSPSLLRDSDSIR